MEKWFGAHFWIHYCHCGSAATTNAKNMHKQATNGGRNRRIVESNSVSNKLWGLCWNKQQLIIHHNECQTPYLELMHSSSSQVYFLPTRNRIKEIADKPFQRQSLLCSHVLIFFFTFLYFLATETTRSRLTSAMRVYSKWPATRNGWGCKWDSFLPYCISG